MIGTEENGGLVVGGPDEAPRGEVLLVGACGEKVAKEQLESEARVWRGKGSEEVKEPRSRGIGWIVYKNEVSRTVVQRQQARYLDEEGGRPSNSIGLKILRIFFEERGGMVWKDQRRNTCSAGPVVQAVNQRTLA